MKYFRKDLQKINKREVANLTISLIMNLTEKEKNEQDIEDIILETLNNCFLVPQQNDYSDFNDNIDELNDFVSDVNDLI